MKIAVNGDIIDTEEIKNNIDWFNEYQKVEDFLFNELGENIKDFHCSSYKNTSDLTIQLIKELLKINKNENNIIIK